MLLKPRCPRTGGCIWQRLHVVSQCGRKTEKRIGRCRGNRTAEAPSLGESFLLQSLHQSPENCIRFSELPICLLKVLSICQAVKLGSNFQHSFNGDKPHWNQSSEQGCLLCPAAECEKSECGLKMDILSM